MPLFLTDIANILTTPPGNLVYHLLLAAFIIASLAIAIRLARSGSGPQTARMVTGLSLLLFARLALFVAAGLAWQGLVSERLLPPIDRAISSLSLTILVWLWLFPNPVRAADVAHILLGLLVLTTLGLTMTWWSGQPETLTYNGTWPDFIGSIAHLVILALGVLFLLVRRPPGWGPGLGMFLLLAAGQAAHLYFLPEGDFAGLVRLAEIMAFPLLILLALRFPITASVEETGEKEVSALEGGLATSESKVDPRLYQSFLALLNVSSASDLPPAITRLVAQVTEADLCLLLSPPDEAGQVPVLSAYDLAAEAPLPTTPALDGRKIPVLVSTLRLGRPVRLSANSTSPDLAALAQALGLNQAGSLLAVPVLYSEDTPAYALLLLSPHTRRTWNPDDQEALTEISRTLAQLLHRYELLADLQTRLALNEEALKSAQVEGEAAGQERQRLLSQLETLRQEAEHDRTQAASLAVLLKAQEALLLKPAPAYEASASAEIERLQGELTLALEEIALLHSASTGMDAPHPEQTGAAPAQEPASYPTAKRIASIADEINRPAASVVEYASLLLNGSSGALDNQQRKYLERIKISGERLRSLVDELQGALSLASGGTAGKVELPAVLARITARLSPQIDEKHLDLRHDYPVDLPALSVDAAALERLLLLLLGDAINSALPQGKIELTAQVQQKSGEPDYLLVQIKDRGPLIPATDIPKLFGQPSQGSSSGAARSLAGARAQAEVIHGKLWFDSDPGYGNRASLLVPVSPVDPVEGSQFSLPTPDLTQYTSLNPAPGSSSAGSETDSVEKLIPKNRPSGPIPSRPANNQPPSQEGE